MALFLPVSTLLGGALFTTKPSWLAGYSAPLDVVVPAAGATCKVFARDADQSTATPIPVYPNEDGSGSPLSQPLVADRDGHFAGFVQQPLALDIALAGAGLTARTVKIGLALDAVYDPAGAAAAAQAAAIAAAEAVDIAIAQKGAANGVGTLDSSGRQPVGQSPVSVASGGSASDRSVPRWSAAQAKHIYREPTYLAQDFGVIADGAQHNNVANLLDCVATAAANGVKRVELPAGTIDTSEAIANATVTADSGRTYTNNGGIPLPVALPITIEGHGKGVTTLKLSAGFPRAFDCWWVADGQLYKNIALRRFTVDRNNLTGAAIAPLTAVTGGVTLTHGGVWTTLPGISTVTFQNARYVWFAAANTGTAKSIAMACRISGGNVQVRNDSASTDFTLVNGDQVQGALRDHVIVGNWMFGGSVFRKQMSFDRITVEGVEAINVSTMTAASLTTAKADSSPGVFFYLDNTGGGGALTATRVVARRVDVWGGESGFQINGDAGMFIDQCGYEDCKHSTQVTPTTNYSSLNYMIGGSAWVGRVWARNCWGELSGDVGVEIDQPWEADCGGTVIEDAWTASFYSTSFVSPARTSAGPPTTTLSGSMTNVTGTAPITALPAGVAAEGFCVIDGEVMWYQSNSAGTSLSVNRSIAANDAGVIAHNSGATVTFHEQAKARIVYSRSTKGIRRRITTGRGIAQLNNGGLPVPRLVGQFEWEREGTDMIVVGEALYSQGWHDWNLDVRAVIAGINYTSAGTQRASVASCDLGRAQVGGNAQIQGPRPARTRLTLDYIASGLVGSGGKFYGFYPNQGYLDLDLDLKASTYFAGMGAQGSNALRLSPLSGSGLTVQGKAKVSNRVPGGDIVPQGAVIGSSTVLTVRWLDLEFEGLLQNFSGSATDSNYNPWVIDSTNAENVMIRAAAHSIATSGAHGYGRRPRKQRVLTGAATINGWDELVAFSTGAITATLHNLSAAATGINPGEGVEHLFVDTGNDAGTNTKTIACGGSDTFVDGTTSKTITVNGGAVRIIAANGKWAVV